MLKMQPSEAVAFINQQHEIYYRLLYDRLTLIGFNNIIQIPSLEFVDAVFDNCANYQPRTNHIQYSIPYACYDGTEYAETVAHEICHAFMQTIDSNAPAHGAQWLWLLRDACKFPNAAATGAYNDRKLIAIEKEIHSNGIRNNLAFRRSASRLSQYHKLRKEKGC